MRKIMKLPSYVQLEYKKHVDSLADKSSFRNPSLVWKSKESTGGGGGGGRQGHREGPIGGDRGGDRERHHHKGEDRHGREGGERHHGRGDRDHQGDRQRGNGALILTFCDLWMTCV